MFEFSQMNEISLLHSMFAIPLATCDTLIRPGYPSIAVLGTYISLYLMFLHQDSVIRE